MFVEPDSREVAEPNGSDSGVGRLAAAAIWVTDAVLAGMVAAGLGSEALSLYLRMSRNDLLARLAGLGLQVSDRPMRRAGKTGWTAEEVWQLIDLWGEGVRARSIEAVLGRSVSSIYSKRRRLGLPPRPRKGQKNLSAAEVLERKTNRQAGAAAAGGGPVPETPGASAPPPPTTGPAFVGEQSCPLPSSSPFSPSSTLPTSSPAAPPAPIECAATPVRPRPPELLGAIERLAKLWGGPVRQARAKRHSTEFLLEVALRALAEQEPKAVAAEMQVSYSTIVNIVGRLGISALPRKLVQEFDVNRAFAFLREKNVEPRTCKGLNRLFFAEKGSGTWFCAEWHKASEVARRERRGIDKKRRCSADNSLGGEAEGLGWLGRSAAEREQINERQRGRFWAAMAAYDAELEAIVRAGEAILDLV